ncbi:MAG: hypothetical protein FWE82_08045, partial [Defluviitaleaceae bacterium]|nr:hypothetical protein [Defluviitaleaceae bacterium]
MKGFYLTKIFCFALVFIMTASLLPFNASAASQFPIYVRNMVDIKSRERQIEITISGMKFTGRMWNSALTQDKIDEIIFEVMEHMRIDGNDIIKYDQQIKKMLEIMGFSQKDFEQIVGNILTVAGLALGGKAGDVVTGAQILYDIICGKPGDAEKSVIEEAGKKIEEKAGGGALGKTKGWYGGGEMLAKEWVKSQVKFNQMRAGLDATREMN